MKYNLKKALCSIAQNIRLQSHKTYWLFSPGLKFSLCMFILILKVTLEIIIITVKGIKVRNISFWEDMVLKVKKISWTYC